eukprot:967355-Amphidinium_carterae.1
MLLQSLPIAIVQPTSTGSVANNLGVSWCESVVGSTCELFLFELWQGACMVLGVDLVEVKHNQQKSLAVSSASCKAP